jgi:hypothetical protein
VTCSPSRVGRCWACSPTTASAASRARAAARATIRIRRYTTSGVTTPPTVYRKSRPPATATHGSAQAGTRSGRPGAWRRWCNPAARLVSGRPRRVAGPTLPHPHDGRGSYVVAVESQGVRRCMTG